MDAAVGNVLEWLIDSEQLRKSVPPTKWSQGLMSETMAENSRIARGSHVIYNQRSCEERTSVGGVLVQAEPYLGWSSA